MQKILVVEDDRDLVDTYVRYLEAKSKENVCGVAYDGTVAIDKLAQEDWDLILIDFCLPFRNGLEVIKIAKIIRPQTNAIMLTGCITTELRQEARGLNVSVLEKPVELKMLSKVLKYSKRMGNRCQNIAHEIDEMLKHKACEKNLKLDMLAECIGISGGHISYLLHKHFGMSFQKRLAYYRIKNVKYLITLFDGPFKCIVEWSGFKNHQRMTETFSRLEGTTPKEYRRRMRQRKARANID